MKRIGILMLVVFFCFVSTAWPQAEPQANYKIITFDAPGATLTLPLGPNVWGSIVGHYADASYVVHGFLRSPHGSFTTFDPTGSTCTMSGNINDFGVIGGYYTDSDGVSHGFLRAPNGTITTIDVKDAGTGSGQGTFGAVVNDFGAIVGWYIDSDGVSHGFLRAPNGTITTIDVKGAGTTPCDLACLQNGDGQGTFPQNITDLLAIPGYYTDSDGVSHGFLRAPNGTITTFDVKDAGTGSCQGTFTDAS